MDKYAGEVGQSDFDAAAFIGRYQRSDDPQKLRALLAEIKDLPTEWLAAIKKEARSQYRDLFSNVRQNAGCRTAVGIWLRTKCTLGQSRSDVVSRLQFLIDVAANVDYAAHSDAFNQESTADITKSVII